MNQNSNLKVGFTSEFSIREKISSGLERVKKVLESFLEAFFENFDVEHLLLVKEKIFQL